MSDVKETFSKITEKVILETLEQFLPEEENINNYSVEVKIYRKGLEVPFDVPTE